MADVIAVALAVWIWAVVDAKRMAARATRIDGPSLSLSFFRRASARAGSLPRARFPYESNVFIETAYVEDDGRRAGIEGCEPEAHRVSLRDLSG